ncbi:MAG TPA: glycosyltransferase family 4 protein [Solirubrobacteraceae bacterium]|jgi:glycosyltransferase involved in cell wall biosynthesis|nr:glycosyltransferase family 4 protein [Solirubrobacteraceae bacterium]
MQPRSVLFVTPRWARDGGVGAHVQASAAALASRGVRVYVLVAKIEDDEPLGRVQVERSRELFNPAAPIGARLRGALASGADIAHVHQVDDPEIVGALRGSSPVVMSAHGYTACTSGVYYFRPGQQCSRGHGPGCVPNLLLRGCAHTHYPKTLPVKYRNAGRGLQALQLADMVVSYSQAVDRHLAANRLAQRMVVPYFPTMGPTEGSGHAARRRVVFAGRVVRPKGVAVLVRAAREVDGEFVICGDGPQTEPMRRLAQRLGVADRVSFKGWLDAGQLAEELANASVVTVPSVWPEPFGLVGIEALASGRPVVATATGGIEEWLDDGVSGLCVPPGEVAPLAGALNELLADPDRQREMGAAGRRAVAERFTAERHLEKLLESYRAAHANWRSVDRAPEEQLISPSAG